MRPQAAVGAEGRLRRFGFIHYQSSPANLLPLPLVLPGLADLLDPQEESVGLRI